MKLTLEKAHHQVQKTAADILIMKPELIVFDVGHINQEIILHHSANKQTKIKYKQIKITNNFGDFGQYYIHTFVELLMTYEYDMVKQAIN